MTTIRITVDNQKHAFMITEMLDAFDFVKGIETEPRITKEKTVSQYQRLKKILQTYANKGLFKEIKDPVKWQRELRNEWE